MSACPINEINSFECQMQVEDLRKEIEAKDSTTKIIMDTEELDAANEQNDALQVYNIIF